MSFNEIGKECVEIARKNGFSLFQNIGQADIISYKHYLATGITGIHSEASEMYEALRKNDLMAIVREGIDVLIRTIEFISCFKNIDIDKEIRRKIEINKKRSFMHGGKIL